MSSSGTLFDALPPEIMEQIDQKVAPSFAWNWVMIHKLGMGPLVARRYGWSSSIPEKYCVACGTIEDKNRIFPKVLQFRQPICMQCAKNKLLIYPIKQIFWKYNQSWFRDLPKERYYGVYWIKSLDMYQIIMEQIQAQGQY
jgi:hypothetical protein